MKTNLFRKLTAGALSPALALLFTACTGPAPGNSPSPAGTGSGPMTAGQLAGYSLFTVELRRGGL